MQNRIVIPSSIEEISTVYNWLESSLKNSVEMTQLQNILLVLQEITTNSVLHGNKLSPDKVVIIDINITTTHIIFNITDEGEGIKKLPTKKEAEELDYLAENGRGLKLAVLMSDKIEVDGSTTKILFNR
jgi:anti-sigma regulatory factor (Ser/Thr protein kinase)